MVTYPSGEARRRKLGYIIFPGGTVLPCSAITVTLS